MSALPVHERHVFDDVQADDVYLVSYPRSGSTWLRCMLCTLPCGAVATPELIQALVPDVYVSHRSATPKPKIHPLVIKSHAPYVAIPSKVIYLVRDGRATLMSYYRYAKKIPAPSLHDTFLRVEDFFFRQDLWPSPWHTHVGGWQAGGASWPKDRYMMIRYEDVLGAPERSLHLIANFVGLEVSEEEIARSVALNSRAHMKKIEESAGEGSFNYVYAEEDRGPYALSAMDLARYETLAQDALRSVGYLP